MKIILYFELQNNVKIKYIYYYNYSYRQKVKLIINN
jgi:hypothetical protein